MDRTRQFRRKMQARMNNHAFRIVRDVWKNKMSDKNVKCMANNMAICSCEMCKNPRHSKYGNQREKLTVQERKREHEISLVSN
mgnify:CR=1 FL=1